MPSNYTTYDPLLGKVDLDDYFIRDAELIDQYIISNPLYAWGFNSSGQLGLGDRTNRSSPVQVGRLENWKQVSAGSDHTVGIRENNSIWSWGNGNDGELGNSASGTSARRSSPVQIGALTNWNQINAADNGNLAVKTDGTLWAWGFNSSGQLGLGDRNSRSSPVQVGAMTNWSSVSGRFNSTFAIKTGYTLWAWGNNTYGQLGLSDTNHRSSPVQVGALTNWKQIYSSIGHSTAVKTDGTLWSWGNNTSGQLGSGNVTGRSSPVQVGTLANWKQVSHMDDLGIGGGSTAAVKTDGTLWTWGDNINGKLGLGDIIHRSSPVQVGALTNWKQVCGVRRSCLAIKKDGTLWSWGANLNGVLGDSGANRSSPVQVGTLTNWKVVDGISSTAAALTYLDL